MTLKDTFAISYIVPNFQPFSRFALAAFSLFLISSASLTGYAQSLPEPLPAAGSTVRDRPLNAGETKSYKVTLNENDFVNVTAEQRNIDLSILLVSASGEKIIEVDSPNGRNGPENLLAVVEKAGEYTIQIRALEPKAEPGRYQLIVEALRPVGEADRNLIEGVKLLREADQLRGKGDAKNLQLAVTKYEQARSYLEKGGNQKYRAQGLMDAAIVHFNLGDQRKALEYTEQAIPFAKAGGDSRQIIEALGNAGAVYSVLGNKEKAVENLQQALEVARSSADKARQGQVMNHLGLVYFSLGQYEKARQLYVDALPLSREVDDKETEAGALNNLGNVYGRTGEMAKAVDVLQQAIEIKRKYQFLNDPGGWAASVTNLGLIYDQTGEKQKALDNYAVALEEFRKSGNKMNEAYVLTNTGAVYISLGEYEKSIEYFNQSLPLRRQSGDKSGEAYTLHHIGTALDYIGRTEQAATAFQQAQTLFESVGDKRGLAVNFNNLGRLVSKQGDKAKGLEYYQKSLALYQETGDVGGQGIELHNLGSVRREVGDLVKAGENLDQALLLLRKVNDRPREASALYELALLSRQQNKLDIARERIEAALAIVESQRVKLNSQALRASYLASVQSYYSFYVDLLMEMNRLHPGQSFDKLAFQASERGRARTLIEMLAEPGADIRNGVDAQLLGREKETLQLLSDKAALQTRLLNLRADEPQLAAVALEVRRLADEYERIQAEIRKTSPKYAALTQPKPASVEEVQALLDKDTVLIEFALGSPRSYAWIVSSTEIKSHELARREDLETAARRFYELVTARNQRPDGETDVQRTARIADADAAQQAAGAELARLVLRPLDKDIEGKRLLIVSQGALQYVPFSALPHQASKSAGSDVEPLATAHEVVSLPSASTLRVLRSEMSGRKPAAKAVAIFADPVFNPTDPRVQGTGRASTQGNAKGADTIARSMTSILSGTERAFVEGGFGLTGGGIPRLPFSRREADAIYSVVPGGSGIKALDFTASRDMALSGKLVDYAIVHFATHGLLNSQNPELSGVILSLVDQRGKSIDGFLRLADIYNLPLNADLVVLSACQTGLGKEVKGEGLIGLTRGFMYAGAPRVVASLWKVDDAATAELMKLFYQGMFSRKLTPSAALRAAKVEMSRQNRWSSPYYWAPFEIQGEWR